LDVAHISGLEPQKGWQCAVRRGSKTVSKAAENNGSKSQKLTLYCKIVAGVLLPPV